MRVAPAIKAFFDEPTNTVRAQREKYVHVREVIQFLA
jgi:hypothetical protein